jgi:hypothetical protein
VVLSVTVVATSFVALGAYRSLAPLVVPGAAEAPPLIVGQTRAMSTDATSNAPKRCVKNWRPWPILDRS